MLTRRGHGLRVIACCLAVGGAVAGCQSGGGSKTAPARGTGATVALSVPRLVGGSTTAQYPPCAPDAVSLTYRGGGFGTGDNFGVIVLTNTGRVTCEVRRVRLRVSPVNAMHHEIRTGPRWENVVTAAHITLTAHGGPPRWGHRPRAGDQWGEILIGGNGRDDARSPSALCAPKNEVTPYAWRVTGSFHAIVRNLDAYIAAHPTRGSSPAVYACADPILDLLNLTLEQQP